MGDYLFVDGGVGDNLPVDVAEDAWDYPVLAVDISSDPPDIPREPSLVQVGTLTYSALSTRVNSLYSTEADFYFRPDLHGARSYTFTSQAADTLVRLGYQQMLSYLREHPEIPRSPRSSRVAGTDAPHRVYRLDSISLQDLRSVSQTAALQWLPLEKGDTVNSAVLRSAAENLYASDMFQRVDYEMRPAGEPGRVDLTYSFREKEPSSIGIGMTYCDQFGLDGRVTYRHQNFLNAGDHLLINAGGGEGYVFGEVRVLDLASVRREWFADYWASFYQMRVKQFRSDGSTWMPVETSGRISACRGFTWGWSGLNEI
jgi:hypothetical protein